MAVGLVAVLIAGCSGDDDADEGAAGGTEGVGEQQEGGTLRVGISGVQTCNDPPQLSNHSSASFARAMTDSLTDLNPETGEIVPWLATSWEVNDDSTSYTFHLRDDVTFSDGTPFNAESVKQTIDHIDELGPKSGRGQAYLANYANTTVDDEFTATVNFDKPSAPFLVGSSTLTFSMLSSATIEELTPEERCQGQFVGTGPFVIESYVQDTNAVVTRRDDYNWSSEVALHDGPAHLERIEYTYLPVPSVRAGALTSGQVDVATSLESPDIPAIEAAGYNVSSKTMPGFPGTMLVNPLRMDTPVRKAVMIGIDRADIVQTVLGDDFNPARSVMTSNLPQFVDHSEDLDRDVAEAGRLLDADGWVMGSDGVRAKDGEPLALSISYSEATGAYYTPLLQLVQQQLNEVGFDITLNLINPADSDRVQLEYDYDMFVTSITEGDPDMVRAMLVEAAAIPELLDELGLTPLMDEQQAVTGDERAAVWAEMQDIIIDNALFVPVFEASQITGSAPNVTGIRSDIKAMLTFYDTAFSST